VQNKPKTYLQKIPRVYHTEINDLLLAALVNTVCKWSGHDGIVVGIEGHGREHLNDTIDISRTVGWFTSLYPLPLMIAGVDGPADLIKTIKEQVRQVRGKGLGYGVLKYINKEPSLQGKDPWDILFNYLGQLDNVSNENAVLKVATGSTGTSVSEEQPVTEKLALNCHVQDGELVLKWSFSKKHLEEETIRNIAADYASNLALLIDHCLTQEKSGTVYTPSDYGLGAEIRYKELDGFLKETYRGKQRAESIDGLYRLSTLQEGMLFHGLYDAGAGTYLDQLACTVTAPDLELFSKSWNHVLKEHGILRTAFYHDEFTVPVQCVYRMLIAVKVEDYSHLKGKEQAAAIKEYEKADRIKGFDFKAPPLMRLSLLRLAEDRYHMLWTWHHVLMDGWSLQIVLEEFLSNYKLLVSGKKVRCV
jgi:non-ribosomal peptide synthase protein (TIGR01720 family)